MDKVKTIAVEILYSLLSGLQVFVVYILPSAVLAVVTSPELSQLISGLISVEEVATADTMLKMGVINLFLAAVGNGIKKAWPNASVSKIL